jgi:hypothetical protein
MNDMESLDDRKILEHIKVDGKRLRAGDPVRLWPLGRADIFDMVLEGKSAVIESIECDLENRVYVAVVIDDDPGQEFGLQRQPGHRFFFGIDEIEPIQRGGQSP